MNKEEIVGALARGYCSAKNEKKVLDIDLIEAMADEVMQLPKPKVLKTAIPYHPDDCPGCVHVHHQKGQYNLIFKCNECGDQRKLTLDPDDMYAFPIGLTSPANDDEIDG